MIVLSFAVAIFVKDAEIDGDASKTIGSEQSYQIDAFDDFFLVTRPMPVNKRIARRVGLFQGRIVENQNPARQIDLRSRFVPQRVRIGFKARQQSSKTVVRGSVLIFWGTYGLKFIDSQIQNRQTFV